MVCGLQAELLKLIYPSSTTLGSTTLWPCSPGLEPDKENAAILFQLIKGRAASAFWRPACLALGAISLLLLGVVVYLLAR